MKYPYFFAVLALVSTHASFAQTFRCGGANDPSRQVEKPKSCDDTGGYSLLPEELLKRPEIAKIFGQKPGKEIETDSKLRDLALEAKFRATSNLNGAKFKFKSGIERIVFRGSYMAPMFSETSLFERRFLEKDHKVQCMKALSKQYGLSKIVNYDELDWPSAVRMTAEEKKLLSSLNPKAKYWEFNQAYGKTFQYKFAKGEGKTPEEKKAFVMQSVANIIKEIEGSPEDQGAVLIHCYGGHHRTGAVYGVLQKCVGKMPTQQIIDEYKCHIGWESDTKKGGYHEDNVKLIQEFPCDQYL